MTAQRSESSDAFNCLNDFSQLMRYQRIFIGNKPDARDCDYLEPAVVLHNWPSQWHSRFPKGYIQTQVMVNKEYVKFDIAANSIKGKKVYLFSERPETKQLISELEVKAKRQTTIECSRHLIAEGKKLQKEGNLYGAVCEYEKVVQLNPSDAPAYSLLGYALFKLGANPEAISILSRGIPLTSDRGLLARMLDARGLAKSNARNSDGARKDFNEALKYTFRSPKVLTHLGILEERCGELEMAYTHALTALRHNPTYEPALRLKKRLEESGHVKPLKANLADQAA